MRSRRFAGLVAFSLLLAPVGARSQPQPAGAGNTPVLTLEEALAIALTSNRTIASGELDVGKAQDRLGATKADRLPMISIDATAARTLNTVEFNVSEGTFGTFPEIGPIPAAETEIVSEPKWTVIGMASLKQPISQLYKIGLGVRAREEEVELAKEDLRADRQSVALQVRKAYYSIVSAESNLAAARESLALSKEVQRVVGERVVERVALVHDDTDAKAAVAQAAYQVASLETQVSASKEQLNVLLGRDVSTDFQVVALPQPQQVADGQAEAIEKAGVRRSDVRRARLQASNADLDARIAKADYLPDLSLTMTYFSPYDVEFQPKGIWSAGLLLQWDIFDWGKKSRNLAEKRKTQEQARLAVAEVEANARMESSRNWRKLQDAARMVAASGIARDAMRDRLRVVKARYDEKASLARDLLSAQSDLAEADHRLNESLVSYWNARAEYEVSIGEDL